MAEIRRRVRSEEYMTLARVMRLIKFRLEAKFVARSAICAEEIDELERTEDHEWFELCIWQKFVCLRA